MIGILGGTFDPIHYGHLRPALDLQQALGLEQIRLIPLRDPPHRSAPIATPQQRLAMLQAAVKNDPNFTIDTRELERSTTSYTVDTLHSLRKELGDDQPLGLIIGSDAFNNFPRWHQPDEILNLANLLVMQRPGESHANHYPTRICSNPATLNSQSTGLIWFQPVTQLEISATRIRNLISNDQSPRYLLPQRVLEIIQQEKLYQTS
ncbi:MAG: nicotinate-nucleotide adenylyltransferase [Gammaproteobacteria bacterium]|nr:nicotinate-nucleotide adenylyltransferase [Gammaproteobacteria bacterium]